MARRVDQADPNRHQIICESAADPRRLTIMQQDAIIRGAQENLRPYTMRFPILKNMFSKHIP
jgi:hypothetical protein